MSEIDPDVSTPEGQRAQATMDRMAGVHSGPLTWRDGTATTISVEITQPQLIRVESRDDPDFTLDIGRSCVDRHRIDTHLTLKSADGRVDESFIQAIFNVADSGEVPQSELGTLDASVHRKASELHGTYVRMTSGDGELTAVYFSLSFDEKGFSGSVSEEITHGDAVSMGTSIASWSEEEVASLPTFTSESCVAAGGVPVLDPGDGSSCGSRKTLGQISGDSIEGAYCCELSAAFCWGPAVSVAGECDQSTGRFYRSGNACVAQTNCTCQGPGCSESFDSRDACEAHYQGCGGITFQRCGGLGGGACAADEYCAYLPPYLCGALDASAVCLPRPAACDDVYAPVCSCDGKTYANLCEANAAGQGAGSLEACP